MLSNVAPRIVASYDTRLQR